MSPEFWKGRTVLVTGHTGFKGSWLSLWLQMLGAEVVGLALAPESAPNMFEDANVGRGMQSLYRDIRDLGAVGEVVDEYKPEIVVHMAAQSLVRPSYSDPVATYGTNVMGTVHVLEAIRNAEHVRAAVIVTSDKCYENREWVWGYRECDPMGGWDPYSSSKGCAELVTAAYRRSFFDAKAERGVGPNVASARAGNVIGGGDWSVDRLIPDLIRGALSDRSTEIRNPGAVRPWQHVLEPLSGYLLLAERLWAGDEHAAEGWNFGPSEIDTKSVAWIADRICDGWGTGATWTTTSGGHPHEASALRLDSSKARAYLRWSPKWTLEVGVDKTVEWYKAHRNGKDVYEVSMEQIDSYMTNNQGSVVNRNGTVTG